MADTLDAALESLRRERSYEEMAAAEQQLRPTSGRSSWAMLAPRS